MPTPRSAPQASGHACGTKANMHGKPKACYRIIKLDRYEIERRGLAGHCTYCNESGHSRQSCAAGRIMRKVPKHVLDLRLRCNVCPLCGDPKKDGHSKVTCPQKQELQAYLAPWKKFGRKNKANVDRQKKWLKSLPQRVTGKKSVAASNELGDMEAMDLIDLDGTFASASTAVKSWPSRAETPRPNLLDTDIPELVWQDADSLPLIKAGGHEGHGIQGTGSTGKDLIDFGSA